MGLEYGAEAIASEVLASWWIVQGFGASDTLSLAVSIPMNMT